MYAKQKDKDKVKLKSPNNIFFYIMYRGCVSYSYIQYLEIFT